MSRWYFFSFLYFFSSSHQVITQYSNANRYLFSIARVFHNQKVPCWYHYKAMDWLQKILQDNTRKRDIDQTTLLLLLALFIAGIRGRHTALALESSQQAMFCLHWSLRISSRPRRATKLTLTSAYSKHELTRNTQLIALVKNTKSLTALTTKKAV